MAKRKRSSTKTRTITRTVAAKPTTIKIAAPSGMQHRARRHAKRARSAVIGGGKKLWTATENQLLAVAGAAGLGFLQKQGVAIPKLIGSLSVPANAGLIAWGAARLLKSTMLDHLATGMLCVGAFGFTSGQTINGDVMGDAVVYDTEGDDED